MEAGREAKILVSRVVHKQEELQIGGESEGQKLEGAALTSIDESSVGADRPRIGVQPLHVYSETILKNCAAAVHFISLVNPMQSDRGVLHQLLLSCSTCWFCLSFVICNSDF